MKSSIIFKDNFSKQASLYAKFRPVYPDELFTYLSSLCAKHNLAWDCGTGNGQCAIQLTNYFENVFASDPSVEQIENAFLNNKITFKVEKAEQSSLESNTVDLIVVAQALHWFEHKLFFDEAKRVLKKDGIMAIVSYVNPVVSPEIDALTDKLHDEILLDFWQEENKIIFNQYREINFPFEEIAAPEFKIVKQLSLAEFLGHLRTWSAVQRFIDKNNFNPIDTIEAALNSHWKATEVKSVTWNLHLIVRRKND